MLNKEDIVKIKEVKRHFILRKEEIEENYTIDGVFVAKDVSQEDILDIQKEYTILNRSILMLDEILNKGDESNGGK